LGVGCGANNPTPEKFTVIKPWRKPRPTEGCSTSEEEEEEEKEEEEDGGRSSKQAKKCNG
jgi:hypothetical protein